MLDRKTVLLVTDFSYQAKGREYFREDVFLSCYVRKFFKVHISHINDIGSIANHVDAVLIRNTGPQAYHQESLHILRNTSSTPLFNDLLGKGDIRGKHHLVELFHLGYPVIPTYRSIDSLRTRGSYSRYLVKPLHGADSRGVSILNEKELPQEIDQDVIIQPFLEFEYEVSFYFIGNQFHYALYAPDPHKRWGLQPYIASQKDIEFALQFIHWNTCTFGIQRVDACRTMKGDLLLMELEDYNPFLSLEVLPENVREQFIEALCFSLEEQMQRRNG